MFNITIDTFIKGYIITNQAMITNDITHSIFMHPLHIDMMHIYQDQLLQR